MCKERLLELRRERDTLEGYKKGERKRIKKITDKKLIIETKKLKTEVDSLNYRYKKIPKSDREIFNENNKIYLTNFNLYKEELEARGLKF